MPKEDMQTLSEETRRALDLRGAAVLVPLVPDGNGGALLMEVRSESVWQPGEICFPGGHVEEGESILQTALRETEEELGIPAASVRVLEVLEPELHREGHMRVHPVLAEISPFVAEHVTLRQEEVAEVFALPLSFLLAHEPGVYDMSEPERPDMPEKLKHYLAAYPPITGHRTTPYWEYGGHGIWGLTARILVRVREHFRKERTDKNDLEKGAAMKTIYLAGGCFWGMQKYFDQFEGVKETEVGYANGPDRAPSYEEVCRDSGHAETVRIVYDETRIGTEKLLDFYFDVIDPLSVNKQGHDEGIQYRTGIFYDDEALLPAIRAVCAREEKKAGQKLAVVTEPLRNFYSAEEYHQKYLEKNPGGYCHIPESYFHLKEEAAERP